MKEMFLWVVCGLGLVAILGYFAWRVILAFASIGEDWKAGKEAEELRNQRKTLESKRAAENAARLANGCEHQWDDMFGVFPPGVCCRCGLEEKRPNGTCDHIWRKIDGPAPYSQCEKCGKQFGGVKRA